MVATYQADGQHVNTEWLCIETVHAVGALAVIFMYSTSMGKLSISCGSAGELRMYIQSELWAQ